MQDYLEMFLRLLLAGFLGGIIGYEREHTHRPAGFRTHILVCVGSALVMLTSEYIFGKYMGQANLDPARLGAQVISGIGFLGAGTIIRDGFNVKGLTTAASLWAVSCVGIAVGIGFYEGAVAATFIIFLTLIMLKRIEIKLSSKISLKSLLIESENRPGQIGHISSIFDQNNLEIRNIEFIKNDKNEFVVRLHVKIPNNLTQKVLISELLDLPGVKKVFED